MGIDGVHPCWQRGQAGRPVATPPEVERLVLGIAISAATWSCRRIVAYLARTWQVRVASSGVQRLLRRIGLAARRARLTVLEQQAAQHGPAADRPHATRPATRPRRLHALLQHRAAAPRLPRPGSNSGRARLGRGGSAVISFTTLERRKCQHRFEPGQPNPAFST
jgi:hypothetical protein